MKTVYKYELKVVDNQKLILPIGSEILSVQEQYDKIVLYALVDDEKDEMENYNIIIHGTGHDANDVADSFYIDTVKLLDGDLMFHVFYNKNKS